MRASRESYGETPPDHYWELHKLAKTLLSWAVLIESLSTENEKLTELEGFGMALRDYSETLEHIRSSVDDWDIEVEQTRRKPKKRKKAA